MKLTSILPSTLAAAGLAITSSLFIPANAFTFGSFTPDNAPVGNPANYNTLPTVGITTADIGDSFTVDWLLQGSTSTDLSAMATFTVNSLSSSLLNLSVNLTNTTASTFQAAILALGFSVSPNGTGSYTSAGTIFDGVSAGSGPNQNFPGGFKDIDVCIFAANNCSGGNINQGLQSGGNSDTFTLNIAGSFGSTPSVTLDAFAIKFQTQQGSFEFPGQPSDDGGGDNGGGDNGGDNGDDGDDDGGDNGGGDNGGVDDGGDNGDDGDDNGGDDDGGDNGDDGDDDGGDDDGGDNGGGDNGGVDDGGDNGDDGDDDGGDDDGGDNGGGDNGGVDDGGDNGGGDNGGVDDGGDNGDDGDDDGGDDDGGDNGGGDNGGVDDGGDNGGGDDGSTKVPEPGTVAGLALLVGAFKLLRRRTSI